MKDAVLKRKQEEIVALRRLGKPQRTRNRLRLKGWCPDARRAYVDINAPPPVPALIPMFH